MYGIHGDLAGRANAMNVKSERFEMRFDPATLDRIDEWQREREHITSRAEAIRELVELGLDRSGPLRFSDGEKLLISMVATIMKHENVDGGVNPEFVEDAMSSGHYWALDWEYPGIYHSHVDSRSAVSETINILEMWYRLEEGYANLSAEAKAQLAKDAEPWGSMVRFPGFSGNEETEHLSIARFLVERMHRFGGFAERDLDSHVPILDDHRRALQVFEPLRRDLVGRTLGLTQMTQILREMLHPSRRKSAGGEGAPKFQLV